MLPFVEGGVTLPSSQGTVNGHSSSPFAYTAFGRLFSHLHLAILHGHFVFATKMSTHLSRYHCLMSFEFTTLVIFEPIPVSAAARLLGLWVRIPPGAWMFVSCVCCVISGRGLCVGLTTLTEEAYRLWCVSVIVKLRKWGGHGPLGAVAPWKKK
jgi:hypothetical protein